MSWSIGIDVGGTFTDLFGERGGLEIVTSKVLTTQENRAVGVIQAIEAANIRFEDVSTIVHGTTTATNALVEGKFPLTGLITTRGFRDVLEIGRQRREKLFDIEQRSHQPFVQRQHRLTMSCRMDALGRETTLFDEFEAREVAARLLNEGVKSIAICFLNAYANSSHEDRMKNVIREMAPDCFVTTSSETLPKFREHSRFSTTVVRAALLPVMNRYFQNLEQALAAKGFKGRLLAIKSNGGMMGVELAKEKPEELVESGPAGGVAYAKYLCEVTGFRNIIHTDVGGTTFDASIVENASGLITQSYELEWETPIAIPMLDIRSVGAGGGSIAWIDDGGSLRVGPTSAGSEPGPACYGRGGTDATVTDANLVLGRLSENLGGKFQLDKGRAAAAIQPLADKLGMSLEEAAEAIITITCENMAQAIKLVLVDRGRDPRDFVLASFGGAGPMHACQIARAMNVPNVIVPAQAGVASAFGATTMDIRHDVGAFFYGSIRRTDPAALNAAFQDLENRAREMLEKDVVQDESVTIERSAQMRYVGQFWEISTPIPSGTLAVPDLSKIGDAFHREHELEQGVRLDGFEAEFTAINVAATAKQNRHGIKHRATRETTAHPVPKHRKVYFEGKWLDAPVYAGEFLGAGVNISGPALIEYDHSEAVIPPGASGSTDSNGNLLIALDTDLIASATASNLNKQLDAVTFEVLRSHFDFTCDRMTKVLQKTAFSPILSDILDFSNAIYDADIRLLAQAPGCPVHMAAMHFAAHASVNRFAEALRPGDVVVLNDPFQGGTHIPDITFTMPIYHGTTLIGYAVSRGHWQDLGGGAAGGQSFGTHIASEGLRLPPQKIFKEYVMNRDLLEIIKNNTRCPEYIEGDIQAHMGALKSAEKEMLRAVERYGLETVIQAQSALIDYTKRITQMNISRLAVGNYSVEDYIDTDGYTEKPIFVRIKLSINGDRIEVDFTGTDKQCIGAVNSPKANTYSAVYLALRYFLCPDAPANAGLFDAVDIILPEDCWLNAKWPAPTIGCTTMAAGKITSAIWAAMSRAMPEKSIGGNMSDVNWFVCAVRDPITGQQAVFSDLPAGGWGAMNTHDGASVRFDPTGNCMNLSAEVAELCYPITYDEFELREGSAGAGKNRGGLGARLKISFKGSAELSIETSRTRRGSLGVLGGGEGLPQRLYKIANGKREVIGGLDDQDNWHNPLLAAFRFNPGESFEIETGGGGGWGRPFERNVDDVVSDLANGYITLTQAEADYGVRVDPISGRYIVAR